MAEENFHGYFGGELRPTSAESGRTTSATASPARCVRLVAQPVDRFDLGKEPNEPNRFGWMVEYDPYDPNSLPVKRTALGRFKHEGATSLVNKDGRVVALLRRRRALRVPLRFVIERHLRPGRSRGQPRPARRRHARTVARFDETKVDLAAAGPGRGAAHRGERLRQPGGRRDRDEAGCRPARRHADGPARGRRAEPGQRPRLRHADQQHPAQGRAGRRRQPARRQRPRPGGRADPAGRRGQGCRSYGRSVRLGLAADRRRSEEGGLRREVPSGHRGLDLLARQLRLRQRRGGSGSRPTRAAPRRKNNIPDGMYACDYAGDGRAYLKFFFACPIGAEMCGPEFTPDGRTLFVAVQHPAEAEASPRPSRTRRRAGRTSPTACRRARRSSRSPRTTAA